MLRRNARLRREYLYRKSLEGKEREEYERKRKIREALEGKTRFSSSAQKTYRLDCTLLQLLLLSLTQIYLTFSLFAEGKPIPTELRKEEQALRKKIDLEDDNTAVPRSHIDDEYAHAEERDPKILVTTSRDPSTRLVQFAKEMKLVLPNAQRINRGGQVMLP